MRVYQVRKETEYLTWLYVIGPCYVVLYLKWQNSFFLFIRKWHNSYRHMLHNISKLRESVSREKRDRQMLYIHPNPRKLFSQIRHHALFASLCLWSLDSGGGLLEFILQGASSAPPISFVSCNLIGIRYIFLYCLFFY